MDTSRHHPSAQSARQRPVRMRGFAMRRVAQASFAHVADTPIRGHQVTNRFAPVVQDNQLFAVAVLR